MDLRTGDYLGERQKRAPWPLDLGGSRYDMLQAGASEVRNTERYMYMEVPRQEALSLASQQAERMRDTEIHAISCNASQGYRRRG